MYMSVNTLRDLEESGCRLVCNGVKNQVVQQTRLAKLTSAWTEVEESHVPSVALLSD